MKIYLPNHKIAAVPFVSPQEIPIAYVDTKDVEYKVKFSIEEDFAEDSSSIMRPYQVVESENIILFDKDKNIIKNSGFRRRGNTVLYEPPGAREFSPSTFTCNAFIKRRATYSSEKLYDIKIGTAEKDTKIPLASKLISIFGNAYKKGLCPPNIKVNGGAISRESMIDAANDNADFVFVETSDGTNFSGLNINTLLDKNINVWISSSQWGQSPGDPPRTLVQEGSMNSFYVNTPRKKISKYRFTTQEKIESLKDNCSYSFPYEDVMLIEKKNKGFVVVTPSDFIENCGDNVKVIYDVLCYIYFNAYKKSRKISSWITNEPVDFAAYSYQKIEALHKTILLDNLIDNSALNDNYKLLGISVQPSEVKYIGIGPNKELLFRKTDKISVDQKKNDDDISYLTSKNTIVFYGKLDAYNTKTRVNLASKKTKNGLSVVIQSVINSDKSIWIDEEVILDIPDIRLIWFICAKSGTTNIPSSFTLIEQSEYSLSKHGHKIAEARVETDRNTKIVDTRVYGGGLPAKEKDDYDLIDIGNVYGRPYRLGSTLIIRLPKRLKPHENKIKQAVLKHIAAGEYPIFVFE